jgi:hypothetical protein
VTAGRGQRDGWWRDDRPQTRFHKNALRDLATDYPGLGAGHRNLLHSLCDLAKWESHRVEICETDLSQHTGSTRRSITTWLAWMAERGLVAIIKPFGSGPEAKGTIEVLCYDRLVLPRKTPSDAADPPSTAPDSALDAPAPDRPTAPEPRPNRALSAPSDAIHQGEQRAHQFKTAKGEGVTRKSRETVGDSEASPAVTPVPGICSWADCEDENGECRGHCAGLPAGPGRSSPPSPPPKEDAVRRALTTAMKKWDVDDEAVRRLSREMFDGREWDDLTKTERGKLIGTVSAGRLARTEP